MLKFTCGNSGHVDNAHLWRSGQSQDGHQKGLPGHSCSNHDVGLVETH